MFGSYKKLKQMLTTNKLFDNLQECKAAELLIQKFNSPQNCIETITDQANNRSTDNINLMLSRNNI